MLEKAITPLDDLVTYHESQESNTSQTSYVSKVSYCMGQHAVLNVLRAQLQTQLREEANGKRTVSGS